MTNSTASHVINLLQGRMQKFPSNTNPVYNEESVESTVRSLIRQRMFYNLHHLRQNCYERAPNSLDNNSSHGIKYTRSANISTANTKLFANYRNKYLNRHKLCKNKARLQKKAKHASTFLNNTNSTERFVSQFAEKNSKENVLHDNTSDSRQQKLFDECYRTRNKDNDLGYLMSLLELADSSPDSEEGSAARELVVAKAAVLDACSFASLLDGRTLVLTEAGRRVMAVAESLSEDNFLPSSVTKKIRLETQEENEHAKSIDCENVIEFDRNTDHLILESKTKITDYVFEDKRDVDVCHTLDSNVSCSNNLNNIIPSGPNVPLNDDSATNVHPNYVFSPSYSPAISSPYLSMNSSFLPELSLNFLHSVFESPEESNNACESCSLCSRDQAGSCSSVGQHELGSACSPTTDSLFEYLVPSPGEEPYQVHSRVISSASNQTCSTDTC